MTALEELFNEYYKDVFRYLYSLCRDASLSEDLASETFLEVVRSIASFRAESDVKTWLFSIARHRWYGYLRKEKRNVQAAVLSEITEFAEPAGTASAEESFLKKELVSRIYSVIENEPERSQNTALMRLDGYSFYEIGKALNISENSARVIFFRVKEKIRRILKEEGFDYE